MRSSRLAYGDTIEHRSNSLLLVRVVNCHESPPASRIVAVADSSGGVHALRGLEVEELIALKARGAHVGELPGVTKSSW